MLLNRRVMATLAYVVPDMDAAWQIFEPVGWLCGLSTRHIWSSVTLHCAGMLQCSEDRGWAGVHSAVQETWSTMRTMPAIADRFIQQLLPLWIWSWLCTGLHTCTDWSAHVCKCNLCQEGVEFVKKPNDGTMKGLAFIKDPDGESQEIKCRIMR